MSNLFQRRRQQHFMLLLKYWRLVFNDHFVIALFFLFGALAYGYSQWLPQLNPHLWWTRWLLVLWFTVLAQFGRFATLLKRPDPIFLLPQVKAMDHYLDHAYRYSVLLATLITLAGTAVELPFAMTTEKLSGLNLVTIVLNAVLVKENWLFTARKSISLQWSAQQWRTRLEYWGNPLIVAAATWLVNPFVGSILAIILTVGMRLAYRDLAIDWRAAVKMETDRMYSVYRFFNLFTDVPSVQGNVKRRQWLAWLVHWLTVKNQPWSYLYAHGFVRNVEVSGLVTRLTIVGMLVAFFVQVSWLNTVLVILFIYLVATQLMPFYDQYSDNVFTHLYPVPVRNQLIAFRGLLTKVTTIEMLLIVSASLGRQVNWAHCGINLILGIIEVFILVHFYVGARIKKMNKWGFSECV